MRIKVLRNLGRGLPPYKENQVVEVDEAEGKRLVDAKLAVPTDEDETEDEIRAVPGTAAIGRAKAPRGSVERATEDLKESRRASAAPATPETIGKNPHDQTK